MCRSHHCCFLFGLSRFAISVLLLSICFGLSPIPGAFSQTDVTDRVEVSFDNQRFNRRTGIFSEDVTLTNISGDPLFAPIRVVFTNLTEGVTVNNPTGEIGGNAFIELLTEGQLDPGQSVAKRVEFLNLQRRRLTFDTLVEASLATAIPIVFGDADGDGDFDEADIQTVVDMLIGVIPKPAPGTPRFVAIDVNGDGVINPADINVMVDRNNEVIPKFPVEPPIIEAALVNDTGSDDTDGLTSDPAIAGTLTASVIVSFLAGFDATPVEDFFDVLGDLQPGDSFSFDAARLADISGGPLPDGAHTLHLQAENEHGNGPSDFDFSFTLDTTAPIISNPVPPDGAFVNNTRPTFSAIFADPIPGSGVDAEAVIIRLDGDDITSEATITVTGFTLTPQEDLSVGEEHQYSVDIKDLAGNSRSRSSTFTIDINPPTITNLFPPDGSSINDTRPTISGDFADDVSGVDTASLEVRLDDQPLDVIIIPPSSFAATPDVELDQGGHTVIISLTDNAGNVITLVTTFTVTSIRAPFIVEAGFPNPNERPLILRIVVDVFQDPVGEDVNFELSVDHETEGNLLLFLEVVPGGTTKRFTQEVIITFPGGITITACNFKFVPEPLEACDERALFIGHQVKNGPPVNNHQQNPERSRCSGCPPDVANNGNIPQVPVSSMKGINTTPFKQDYGDPVYLHNGEFFLYEVDLEIPGRGFNWKFERKYRSGILFEGLLGHNWEFNYNRRLFVEEPSGDVLRMDGYGRVDRYILDFEDTYIAPKGFYTRLTTIKDANGNLIGFAERDRNGTTVIYSQPDENGLARMGRLVDRNGNTMRFVRNVDDPNKLETVIDTLGRSIQYRYDDGRLVEVEDFIGRKITFEYDANGDLVAVTSPAVENTPNGNDFLGGKTTQYRYSSGFADERLNHNLLEIIAPNEVAADGPRRVENVYGEDGASPADFDRVKTQTYGGTNASGVEAGATIFYSYTLDSATADDFIKRVEQTNVQDRNGNRAVYQFDELGSILRFQEFTNRSIRSSDSPFFFFETQYVYNADGELTRMTNPEGNFVRYIYDTGNSDRLQQGNLREEIWTPDADRGGDQTFIKTKYTYEPIYNQVQTVIEARGNDSSHIPQNGGAQSSERYTTVYTFDYQEGDNFAALADKLGIEEDEVRDLLDGIPMNLGDVNGDRVTNQINGNIVREEAPTVNLLLGSNQAAIEGSTQPIVSLYLYNQFGQMTEMRDPEGNVDLFDYHPYNDPDGDGQDLTTGIGTGPFGYLKEVTSDVVNDPIRNSGTDPMPTAIRNQFFYDPVGNVIQAIDGRGIRTDYAVNELNQVVEIKRAAVHNVFAPDPPEPLPLEDFQYLEHIFYDFNDNVIQQQIEDRGNTSSVGGFVDYTYAYDILDNLLQIIEEVGDGEPPLVTRYRYDRNENPVLEIQPEGVATSNIYDERDLLFQSTRGATSSPQPPALIAGGDPTNYNIRGGLPSTMTYHYDGNRNLIEVVDAADTDGSTANNSDRPGFGDRTRIIYDGFDRLTSVVDSVGNQSVTQYDPASNVVRVASFGPVGGPSDTADGPDILPTPVSSNGEIQTDKLVNANLLSATEYLHDELSRVFQTDRVLFVNTIPLIGPGADVADGASDIGKGDLTPGDNQGIPGISGISIIGRVTTRTEYDRNSRLTFTVEDDVDTYRIFHDGAGRVIKTIDPEDNIVETAYDDDHNVIEMRATDIPQLGGGDEIFLTTYFYDSLDRLQRSVNNLGQTMDYRYDSRDHLVAMADAKGPPGPDVTRRAFSEGSLTVNTTNLFGNVTRYFYDGVSRTIREESVLTATGEGDGVNIGADIFGIKGATPPPDLAQGGGDGLITTRYAWDANFLLKSLTDDNGNQTRYTYDNLNRQLTETKGISVTPNLADRDDPDTTITYEYDPDDNLTRIIDENGSMTDCDYDAIDRRIDCDITPASGVVGTTDCTYEYDGLSRMTRAADNNEPSDLNDDSTVTYAYDSLSRVIEETQKIGGLGARAISSGWRAENLNSSLIYPAESGASSRRVNYTYDLLDRLNTVADPGETIADYDYIGTRRVLKRHYPGNGTRQAMSYDGLRRTTQLQHLRADTLVLGFTHTYDRMNNKGIEEKLHDSANSELYAYDSVYRLIDFQRGQLTPEKDAIDVPSPNALQRQEWDLDGVGNWRQNVVTDAGVFTVENREHSSFNEITRIADGAPVDLDHDDNGNLTDDGNLVFEWDYRNRLRTATRKSDGAPVAVYAYEAMNRRIRKIVNPGPSEAITDFYYDGWRVLEERDGVDVLTQQYVYGIYLDEALALDRNLNGDGDAIDLGDQRLFYHQNTLYHVYGLTDETGALAEAYQYDAYGKATVFTSPGTDGIWFTGDEPQAAFSNVNNPYTYTGQRLDPETGLMYYKNRYYNTELGRFYNRNPWKYIQSRWNLYDYVWMRPTWGFEPLSRGTPPPPPVVPKPPWRSPYGRPRTGTPSRSQELPEYEEWHDPAHMISHGTVAEEWEERERELEQEWVDEMGVPTVEMVERAAEALSKAETIYDPSQPKPPPPPPPPGTPPPDPGPPPRRPYPPNDMSDMNPATYAWEQQMEKYKKDYKRWETRRHRYLEYMEQCQRAAEAKKKKKEKAEEKVLKKRLEELRLPWNFIGPIPPKAKKP